MDCVFSQALSTNGATAFTSLSVAGGRSLLVVANGGSPGNREVNSVVYEFVGEEQVQVVSSTNTQLLYTTLETTIHLFAA